MQSLFLVLFQANQMTQNVWLEWSPLSSLPNQWFDKINCSLVKTVTDKQGKCCRLHHVRILETSTAIFNMVCVDDDSYKKHQYVKPRKSQRSPYLEHPIQNMGHFRLSVIILFHVPHVRTYADSHIQAHCHAGQVHWGLYYRGSKN